MSGSHMAIVKRQHVPVNRGRTRTCDIFLKDSRPLLIRRLPL